MPHPRAPAPEAEMGLTGFGATRERNPRGQSPDGAGEGRKQVKLSCKSQAPCHNRLLQTGSVPSPAGGRAARPPHLPFLFHLLAFPAPVPCIVLLSPLSCGRLQQLRVSQHSLEHPPPGSLLSPAGKQRSCSPSGMLLPPLKLAAALQGSAPRQHVPQAGGCSVHSCSSQQSPRGSGIRGKNLGSGLSSPALPFHICLFPLFPKKRASPAKRCCSQQTDKGCVCLGSWLAAQTGN